MCQLFDDFVSAVKDFNMKWDYVQGNAKDGGGSGCGIHLKQLRKATINLIQNSQFPNQVLNQVTPEYKSDAVVSVCADLYCKGY